MTRTTPCYQFVMIGRKKREERRMRRKKEEEKKKKKKKKRGERETQSRESVQSVPRSG